MDSTDREVEVKKNIINKIKVPKEQKEKIYVKIFKEFGIAILIFLYFLFLDLGYIRVEKNVFENDLHTFAGVLVISAVLLFESAYRKDSGEIAIHGVEVLVLAVLTLFMPYIYFYRGVSLKFLYSISPIYIAGYFAVKSFVIYNKEVKKYKDSLSDVKEILTDDEKSYLDEENEKKFDEIKLENEEPTKKSNTRKKMAKMIGENNKKPASKRGRKKKVEIDNIQNEDSDAEKQEVAEETVPKKTTRRGRPRKKAKVEDVSDGTEETVKKTSTRAKKKKKTTGTASTTTAPKKRGRPRKTTTKIDVKPLATAGRSKKKDGDSEND